MSFHSPVLGICGYSGSGKTTLVESLVPLLKARGLTVSVIKHSHHDIELEPQGKDSRRFREAGAAEVIVSSPYRFALIQETHGRDTPLTQLIAKLMPVDLILVEGLKHEAIPKIEVYRACVGKPRLSPADSSLIAVASDAVQNGTLPSLPLDQPDQVCDFIFQWLHS